MQARAGGRPCLAWCSACSRESPRPTAPTRRRSLSPWRSSRDALWTLQLSIVAKMCDFKHTAPATECFATSNLFSFLMLFSFFLRCGKESKRKKRPTAATLRCDGAAAGTTKKIMFLHACKYVFVISRMRKDWKQIISHHGVCHLQPNISLIAHGAFAIFLTHTLVTAIVLSSYDPMHIRIRSEP